MEIDELLGLPAHPLLVHVPVVLVPLAATAVLAALLLGRARSVLVVVAAVLALSGAAGAQAAAWSGEPLEDRVEETDLVEDHTELGEGLVPWVAAFAVVAIAAAGASASPRARRAAVPLLAVAALSGVVATVQVARVGHSGARAAWEDVDEDGGGDDRGDRDNSGPGNAEDHGRDDD